jgi:hypothetical protein
MKFSLSAHFDQATGKYVASLYQESKLVETNDSLRSVKAVRSWARNAAEEYKRNNLPASSESHSYSATLHL